MDTKEKPARANRLYIAYIKRYQAARILYNININLYRFLIIYVNYHKPRH